MTDDAAGLPWPDGDATALTVAAQQMATAEDVLSLLLSSLASAAAGPSGWRGAAATAFARTIDAEIEALREPPQALLEACVQLRDLADLVDASQAEIRRLAEEVRQAEGTALKAEAAALLLWLAVDTPLAHTPVGDLITDRVDDPDATADRARRAATDAHAHADDVRTRATRRAQHLCDEVRRRDFRTADAVNRAASLAPLGGSRPASGPLPARAFGASAFSGLSAADWQQATYFLAGVTHWDPDEGLLANDANVQAVYTFYGQLWTKDHDLQWAGMANLVGKLLYGGWQDLYALRTHAVAGEDRTALIFAMLRLPDLPDIVYESADFAQNLLFGPLQDLGDEELFWFEQRFLSMQKQIFDDLAWKHVAYEVGGIGLLRDLNEQGQLSRSQLAPFDDIASGDPERVAAGTEALVRHEQLDIIQNDYDAMAAHDPPVGAVFCEMLTWTADNPVPGGRSYRDLYHEFVGIGITSSIVPDLPFLPEVGVGIDVPSGSVTDFDDRWRWIQEDMLPAYQLLLLDPDRMQALIDISVADRAAGWRLTPLPYP